MQLRTLRTRTLLRIAVALVAPGAALACQILADVTLPDRPTVAAFDDASTDAAPASTVPFACSDLPLRAPPTNVVGGEQVLAFVMSTVRYNTIEDAGTTLCPYPGFDLDRKQTCWDDQGEPRKITECPAGDATACAWGPSCNPRAPTEPPDKREQCDLRGGIDNAFRNIDVGLGQLVSSTTKRFDVDAIFAHGLGNLVLQLSGYNGLDDDDDVGLGFLASSGLASTIEPLPDAAAPDGAPLPTERWDQHSLRVWYIDPDTVRNPSANDTLAPKYVADDARVVHGVLVAHTALMPAPFALTVDGRMHDTTFTAEIHHLSDGQWVLTRGRIGGRMPLPDLLRTIASVPYSTTNGTQTLCNNPTLPTAVGFLCSVADLGAPAGGDCNEMSIGLAFVAVPGILGELKPLPQRAPQCDASLECP